MGHAHQLDSRRKAAARNGDAGHAAEEEAAQLELQRTAGNRAVSELIAGAQAKLKVGAVDDPLERDADAVAEEVVRTIRSGGAGSLGDHVQRRADGGGDAGGDMAAGTDAAVEAARGGGQPLPEDTRAAVEDAFGADFSDVRVHTGPEAKDLSESIGAQAFTVGSDIFFAGGLPGPTDSLLSHELTHVIQQRGGGGDTAQRKETGSKVKTSTETTVEHTDSDTTTTTETKNQLGKGSSTEETNDTFDGTTQTTTTSKDETFAGAETAVKTIKKASADEIEYAIEAMARAGAFGETSRKAAVQRGALSAKAEGSAKGGAGAETSMKASVKVSPNLYNAIFAVLEAGASVGVSGELQGSLEAALGPLAVEVKAQLSAMAGAMVKTKATLSAGLTHVYATFEGEAFAGAKAEGSGEAKVKLGDAEATAAIEGKALAGAQAQVEGKFKIDLSGVEIGGKAEAFAGVKASAGTKMSIGYKGVPILTCKGEVEVSAGVGGKAKGSFGVRNGKLTIKGGLAASLGIGAGAEVELEIDFYQLALAIEDLIVSAFLNKKEAIPRNSPSEPRTPIIDDALAAQTRQKGYDAYIKDFAAYNAKKEGQGKSGIKRERIEQIIEKRWHANKDNWQFEEFDQGVAKAAEDAFKGKVKWIIVQCGIVRGIEIKRTAEQEAHLKKERMKKGLKF